MSGEVIPIPRRGQYRNTSDKALLHAIANNKEIIELCENTLRLLRAEADYRGLDDAR